MEKVGFLVNPIAGMGGKVGLKGTDGVVEEAKKRGAQQVSNKRALDFLNEVVERDRKATKQLRWLVPSGNMGESILNGLSVDLHSKIIYETSDETNALDTQNACRKMLEEGAELIVFVGGDGTARDVWKAVDKSMPILGVPSGVKMHSGVFGTDPKNAGVTFVRFIQGEMEAVEAEIMDLDEERYRQGDWNIKLFGHALVPNEPHYIQTSKMHASSVSDDEMKEELADFLEEKVNDSKGTLFLMGSGSTIGELKNRLMDEPTLLGIDAYKNGSVVGKDLNEEELLELLKDQHEVILYLSPIGAQGFILGRGNLQISPEVVRKIGVDNIVVVATPGKLKRTPFLRVDTGDGELNQAFRDKGYVKVLTKYRTYRLVKIQN